ncbi:ribonuclease HI [Oscillatoria salina]|uniref:ribonuclease HI n=1 Tax=Oscillatoria salina TaxID=331517 RepID=UPI0013B64069|nr:ribonuclease HI [Oscillatoria salina]MBZ8182899.1 ribonuclease HI [Oscillatoria salina IIICB1]NET88940.1 ribonuclease HI [Kamptonema sp. SIO1D9]
MSSTRTIKSFYTDGACIANPGPGGWAVVVYFADGSVFEMGDRVAPTTNNRMELQAAIAALKIFAGSNQTEPVTLYTDSEYVQKGITQWIHNWKKRGWQNSQGKPVENKDLWEALERLNSPLIDWQHIRGHSGDEGNERCDAIANAFARGQIPDMLQEFSLLDSDEDNRSFELPVAGLSDFKAPVTIVYKDRQSSTDNFEQDMSQSLSTTTMEEITVPREVRVAQLRNLRETLAIADEVATKGYLITSSELADLMDVNASAVTSRGDNWPWRNWVVSRVRREGNQILWQLERVD